MRKTIAILMTLLTLFFVAAPVYAADNTPSEDIVILYTNDVHSYIDGPLSYPVIAAIKKELQQKYKYVLLADAGDHIQGTAYGSMDKGKTVIELMNAAGYDIATLGNHEFDYNMSGCMNAISLAKFSYVSANFYHEKDGVRGENVLPSYKIFDCGKEKLAFVGITTPETFSKSTTSYFQDGNGKFIYGISGGNDGSAMQNDVQNAINKARAEGATHIIALGHLGIDPSSSPWTSIETIGKLSGIDAFIDGHSHSVIEKEPVRDADGNDVVLTQTGEYFNRIGIMVIDSKTGKVDTDLIECEEVIADDGKTVTGYKLSSDIYTGTEIISEASVGTLLNAWLSEIDQKLGEKIGSTALVFDNYDTDGNRLVRSKETNSGDLSADALYYLFDSRGFDVDVAVMNGGGIRNKALTGDITYKICKDVHPFGNVACLLNVTGKQILDMLEWGARNAGAAEDGSFLHVSGVKYKIDTSIENTTKADEMDVWIGGPSEYRVHSIEIYNKETNTWEALDPNAQYGLAGYNYTLRDLGGGFAMLNGAINVIDYVMEDYMVLANYISSFDGGVVKATNSPLLSKYPNILIDYSSIYGAGRIGFGSRSDAADDITDTTNEPSAPNNNGKAVIIASVTIITILCIAIVLLNYKNKTRSEK